VVIVGSGFSAFRFWFLRLGFSQFKAKAPPSALILASQSPCWEFYFDTGLLDFFLEALNFLYLPGDEPAGNAALCPYASGRKL
jgi:hypothetical protein